MTLDEITKSLLHTARERLTSPFTGALILSWIAWNYKAVLVLFSSKSVEDKIIYWEFLIYRNDSEAATMLLWGPLLTAFLIVTVYPIGSLMMYGVWAFWQKQFRKVQLYLDKDRLVSRAELRDWQRETYEQMTRYARDIEQKDALIQGLRNGSEEQTALIEQLKTELAEATLADAQASESKSQLDRILREKMISSSFSLLENTRGKGSEQTEMIFGPDGLIIAGRTNEINSWRIDGGFLEFLDALGEVYNRFFWKPNERAFIGTNEDELPARKGQALIEHDS